MPEIGQGVDMVKGDEGVWEAKVGPVDAGAYRYNFNVDGVTVIDPRNAATSESNSNTWSLVYVSGSEKSDTLDVPHGAVAAVTYYSKSLKQFRRMHVYTPPGYQLGAGKYPVFYLLHGAGDSDQAWSTVGRAGFILDNLIAVGKAEPMVVVMPAGHAGAFGFGRRGTPDRPRVDQFVEDFVNDLQPYVEQHYRILADREHRAIAGLSMGGAQTLNIAVPHLDEFAYVGVFSSGVFELGRRSRSNENGPSWEQQNEKSLSEPALKEGLELFWFATGRDDFLIETSRSSVAMLQKHGFDVVFQETAGGHTWINWRQYLHDFAQVLFKPGASKAIPGADTSGS